MKLACIYMHLDLICMVELRALDNVKVLLILVVLTVDTMVKVSITIYHLPKSKNLIWRFCLSNKTLTFNIDDGGPDRTAPHKMRGAAADSLKEMVRNVSAWL